MGTGKHTQRPIHGESLLGGVAEGETVILLRVPGARLSRDDVRALLSAAGLSCEGSKEAAPGGRLHVCHGVDVLDTYVYMAPEPAAQSLSADMVQVQRAVSAAYPGADATVLEVTQVVDGVSAGLVAGWHYVVETDVVPQAERDFNDWYEREHLPGLAAVPGTVRAMRLRNPTGSPRYHALYLLGSQETFGSDPWMKVRATEWSSRVRPNFIHTKRTMFEIDAPADIISNVH